MGKVLTLIFVALLAGVAALLYWGPVEKYMVECERASNLACVLERDTAAEIQRWNVDLAPDAKAEVRIVVTRGRKTYERTFLYLRSGKEDIFAAEFQGDDAASEANAAAAQLNHVFQSDSPAKTRIEVQPSAYLRWRSWIMFGVMALLVALVGKKAWNLEETPADPGKPTHLSTKP